VTTADWFEVSSTLPRLLQHAGTLSSRKLDCLVANSSSRNAVSFSSARTTKRFPSSRCASAIQIVRPRRDHRGVNLISDVLPIGLSFEIKLAKDSNLLELPVVHPPFSLGSLRCT